MFAILLQVLKRNESLTSKTADPPSSAILVVYLDKAEALPVSQIPLPSRESCFLCVLKLGQSCHCHLSLHSTKLLLQPLTLLCPTVLQRGCVWLTLSRALKQIFRTISISVVKLYTKGHSSGIIFGLKLSLCGFARCSFKLPDCAMRYDTSSLLLVLLLW